MSLSNQRGRWIWTAVLVGGTIYSAVHFALSGVREPLRWPNVGQVIEEESLAVQAYLAHGRPVEIKNRRQYGPTYFFIAETLLRRCGTDLRRLSHWLYGIQLVCFSLAFLFTVLSLRLWSQRAWPRARGEPLPFWQWLALLSFLWLNFAPAYYIMAIKNVEMWELCLIAAGLYCYLRRWRLACGFLIAAAALTKMLPAIFLFYFLIRDRRQLLYCSVGCFVILTISHLRYGPQMGYLYLPFILKATVGNTWALICYENVSAKGMLVKFFGHWKMEQPNYVTAISPQGLVIANVLGHGIEIMGMIWVVWTLVSSAAEKHPQWEPHRPIWEWSFMSIVLFILSPHAGFDYMVLALIAFSVVLAALVWDAQLREDRVLVTCFGAAVVLIANVVPRQAINRLLPIAFLNRVSGNAHLTLSEGYQYFGFPLLGMLCMLAALWRFRNRFHAHESRVEIPVAMSPT